MSQGKPSDQDGSQQQSYFKWAVGFGVILLIWFIVGFWPSQGMTREDAAQFGDSFGFVNSLFSALALFGVIIAIFLQRNELALQRSELIETRRIHEQSMRAQQASEEELSRQVQLMSITALLSALNSEDAMIKAAEADSANRKPHVKLHAAYLRKRSQILTSDVLTNLLKDSGSVLATHTSSPGASRLFKLNGIVELVTSLALRIPCVEESVISLVTMTPDRINAEIVVFHTENIRTYLGEMSQIAKVLSESQLFERFEPAEVMHQLVELTSSNNSELRRHHNQMAISELNTSWSEVKRQMKKLTDGLTKHINEVEWHRDDLPQPAINQ